jgi:hypothetical protein
MKIPRLILALAALIGLAGCSCLPGGTGRDLLSEASDDAPAATKTMSAGGSVSGPVVR